MSVWKNFIKGVIKENPTLVLILGTCPTLAMTDSVSKAFGMGIAATVVLICSNMAISALRNVIPDKVRIPCYIVLIAGFVTVVEMVMHAYLPDLYEAMGVFLSLIVVNCIILGRAESFASKNPVLDSACDGLFTGLGFTAALTLMGAFREILGSASVFGFKLWDADAFSIGFFSSSAGAFFTFAIFIAVFNYVVNKVQKKRALKPKEVK